MRACVTLGWVGVLTLVSLGVGARSDARAQSTLAKDMPRLEQGGLVRGTTVAWIPDGSAGFPASNGSPSAYGVDEAQWATKAPMPEDGGTRSLRPRKEPWLALLLSVWIPGAGQFYNGEAGKGIFQLGLCVAGGLLFLAELPETESPSGYFTIGSENGNAALSNSGLVLAGASAVWSMIDAPLSANRINRERGWTARLGNHRVVTAPVVLNANSRRVPGLMLSCRF